ncbi:MAG: hypothetical protein JXA10_08475, partial [Anaerolineae bacterium]|nr:hypothetical protein [Anaerolineae bacterium]
MDITLYESEVLFDELAAEWGDLLEHSTRNQIFLTPIWLKTWWDVYQPGTIWALVLRDKAGQLMGIAPWYRTTGDDGMRLIGAIGGVEVTDYVDVITRQESEEVVYSALGDWLAAHK